jgi:hypothetical protein
MENGLFFWKDTWLGDVPLSIKYHKFFEKCGEKDALVADYFVEDDWEVDLLRPLMSGDLHSWGEFMGDLQNCCLTQGIDYNLGVR